MFQIVPPKEWVPRRNGFKVEDIGDMVIKNPICQVGVVLGELVQTSLIEVTNKQAIALLIGDVIVDKLFMVNTSRTNATEAVTLLVF